MLYYESKRHRSSRNQNTIPAFPVAQETIIHATDAAHAGRDSEMYTIRVNDEKRRPLAICGNGPYTTAKHVIKAPVQIKILVL